MKMINKIAAAGLGLAMMGSSAFAQSLADAKKAIDAEQMGATNSRGSMGICSLSLYRQGWNDGQCSRCFGTFVFDH